MRAWPTARSTCIGTDHAPHPLEMKDCEWQAGAFGMTGLETALPILIETMVNTGRMDWRGHRSRHVDGSRPHRPRGNRRARASSSAPPRT